ncbi:hypothetical protein SDC9_199015 [bioreactor metagenome]|uniref:Uncharacterized protein n=1 Tax=bioreactor metagenome TaxID=1076179 RepID=A0A645IKI4_9ZZZZ
MGLPEVGPDPSEIRGAGPPAHLFPARLSDSQRSDRHDCPHLRAVFHQHAGCGCHGPAVRSSDENHCLRRAESTGGAR